MTEDLKNCYIKCQLIYIYQSFLMQSSVDEQKYWFKLVAIVD